MLSEQVRRLSIRHGVAVLTAEYNKGMFVHPAMTMHDYQAGSIMRMSQVGLVGN